MLDMSAAFLFFPSQGSDGSDDEGRGKEHGLRGKGPRQGYKFDGAAKNFRVPCIFLLMKINRQCLYLFFVNTYYYLVYMILEICHFLRGQFVN